MNKITDKIILASQSPRRRELLYSLGFDFEIITPDVCEDLIEGLSPADFAATISRRKLDAVLNTLCRGGNLPPAVAIIAADTVVSINNKILGKPIDENDAFDTLKTLSNNWHSVFTGLSVSVNGIVTTEVCETRVKFRNLTDDEILAYIKTGKPLDKAGSYGIQECDFVEKYDGSYNNVVGLPTEMLMKILEGGVTPPL